MRILLNGRTIIKAQGTIAVGPKARLVEGDCVADAAESPETARIATRQIPAGVAFSQGPAERRDHCDHRGTSGILTRDLMLHWIPERMHGWFLRIPVPDEAARGQWIQKNADNHADELRDRQPARHSNEDDDDDDDDEED